MHQLSSSLALPESLAAQGRRYSRNRDEGVFRRNPDFHLHRSGIYGSSATTYCIDAFMIPIRRLPQMMDALSLSPREGCPVTPNTPCEAAAELASRWVHALVPPLEDAPEHNKEGLSSQQACYPHPPRRIPTVKKSPGSEERGRAKTPSS